MWVLVAVVLASGKAWACLGLAGVFSVLATIEYFRMLRAGGVACFPRFGGLLAAVYVVVLYWWLLRDTGGGLDAPPGMDAAAVLVATAGAFVLQLRYPIRGIEGLLAVGANLLGFVYLVLMFNFTARLLFLPQGGGEMPGLWVVLWGVAVTKFTDMGAYLVGSAIGRHKMIPHVSPGKTWEGFGGALLFAQLAGCGLFALMPGSLAVLGGWWQVVVLGLVLALLAVLGDLAESVLKRSVDAKDSGGFLPGIGGAMDLIDSLCFTMPVLYFYLKWTAS
jgi:phosphatidate cytidylyltransferase